MTGVTDPCYVPTAPGKCNHPMHSVLAGKEMEVKPLSLERGGLLKGLGQQPWLGLLLAKGKEGPCSPAPVQVRSKHPAGSQMLKPCPRPLWALGAHLPSDEVKASCLEPFSPASAAPFPASAVPSPALFPTCASPSPVSPVLSPVSAAPSHVPFPVSAVPSPASGFPCWNLMECYCQ